MEKLIIILALLVILFFWLWLRTKRALTEVSFRKASLSTKYGRLTEQFMPFLKNYPYNPDNFRFIGSPIDGIQFEEDKIVLVEFKAANSGLSSHQKQIADTIDRKKVFFEEIRLS